MAYSPTGEWLVSVGQDGLLKIWSPDGSALASIEVGPELTAVAVSPDAGYIATVDVGGGLALWGVP